MRGSAIVAGLGRYQITYRADTGLFYSPVELSEEAKAKIRSDGMAYAGVARFLTKGAGAVSHHITLSWWSHLQPVPIEEGPCVPLRDRNIYESIQLDWEEREVASQTPVRHGDVGAARFQKERRLCVLSLRPNPVKRYAGVQNCDLLAD